MTELRRATDGNAKATNSAACLFTANGKYDVLLATSLVERAELIPAEPSAAAAVPAISSKRFTAFPYFVSSAVADKEFTWIHATEGKIFDPVVARLMGLWNSIPRRRRLPANGAGAAA
jgi:hypothetical protein